MTEDTDYALGRTAAEYDRLIEQADLLRPLTERMLRASGITSGMRVLDVGCGVGDVSFLVSELVGPTGSVVGADLDDEALAMAEQRRSSLGFSNVAFSHGDARTIDGEYDAAVGRFVLMYMGDTAKTLRQIAERVRPGGILAFHEMSATATLEASRNRLPVLTECLDLMTRTFALSGAQPDAGAELYSRMLEVGLEPNDRPVVEFAHSAADVAHRRWTLLKQSLLPKIVGYGLATESEVRDLFERRLREEFAGVEGLLPLNWLMIGQWATKPMA